MNWKLIFTLSLFGLAMAIATIFWIPWNIEPIFWLVIFIICAYLIAKNAHGKYFLHGLLVSIVNSIWITVAHILFFETYVANHPEVAEMNARLPMADRPKIMMAIMGPIYGVIFGIILGLFAFIASRLLRRRPHAVR